MPHPDPFKQFDTWFQDANKCQIVLPEGMTLATVDEAGNPDARIVLLKEVSPQGFVFFTNYESTKSQQLSACPSAALVFWWAVLERQVRVRGGVSKISSEQSDAYFKTRPRGSQLGAWASHQSQVLKDRADLEQAYGFLDQKYVGQEVPRPPHWGGYCLTPHHIEFWQGRESRLHDRWVYDLDSSGVWEIKRLAP